MLKKIIFVIIKKLKRIKKIRTSSRTHGTVLGTLSTKSIRKRKKDNPQSVHHALDTIRSICEDDNADHSRHF